MTAGAYPFFACTKLSANVNMDTQREQTRQFDVQLNIYDLVRANRWLDVLGVGAYHSGVEVNGVEYFFAADGVCRCAPRSLTPGAGGGREDLGES